MANVRSNLSVDEVAGITDLISVARANETEVARRRYEVIAQFIPELLEVSEFQQGTDGDGLVALEAAAAAGDLSSYYAEVRVQLEHLAESGLSFEAIGQAVVELVAPVGEMLDDNLDDQRAMRAMRILHRLETDFLLLAGAMYATFREDAVETEYQEAIRKLSTPVIDVWDEMVLMPLIGVVDTARAKQMMEQLLDRIVTGKARIVILDITGVPTVDTAVAEHIIQTTKAAHLVGAKTLLVGISPQVAQTLVRLGVSLGNLSTFADLRSGLERALRELGYEIHRSL